MKAEQRSIRRAFGLPHPTEASEDVDKDLERELVAVGGRVLWQLNDLPGKTARLHDLIEKLGITLETLLRVVEQLEKLEFISVEREKYGNHRIQLTRAGEGFLTKSQTAR